VEVGVVPLLIELLPDAKRSNVELALGVLEVLCTTAEGRAIHWYWEGNPMGVVRVVHSPTKPEGTIITRVSTCFSP
jgi:hypothetical protein